VTPPAAEGVVALTNASRTISSGIRRVEVNITAPANAAIKIGDRDFIQGQSIDFADPVTNATGNPYGIYTVRHLADVANKGNLNASGSVWGRSDAKNDKLPYINGVGK